MTTGRRSALLVATDRYEDEGLTQLRAPAGDAAELAEVLGDPAIGGFEVRPPLLNQPEGVVRREIDGFLGSARLGDTVLLYSRARRALAERPPVLRDGRHAARRPALDRGPGAFVHDAMQDSRAHRKVLILDCCHSGAFARGMAPKSDRQVHVGDRFQGRGHVTLTASDELEYALEEDHVESLEGAQANSLFTRAVVEGLRSGEADVNGDGLVSVDELYEFVFDHMRNRTTSQTPGIEGVVRGEIIIATAPRREKEPDPVPPPPAPRARLAPQVANLLRRAEAKRARGELEPARGDLDAALRLSPDAIEVLAARGELRRRLGEFAGAREDFAAALALDADDYASLVGRGRVDALLDGTEAGLAALARAIALDPGCPDAYLARGFVLAFAVPPRRKEAAADFEQVLGVEPEHAEALAGVGILAAADRPKEASAAFERALKAEDDQPLALAFRGALRARRAGDAIEQSEGLEDLERAAGLDPKSPYIRAAHASTLSARWRPAEAIAELDAVLAMLPRDAAALAQRGAMQVQLGKPDAALADLEAALAIDPRNATALLWRGTVKLRRSDPEAALEDLDAVVDRDEEALGPPVAQLRAEALLALGRAEEALGDLEAAPASALDAELLAVRGTARLELGRPGDALADAEHALELHATHDAARDLLAALLPRPRGRRSPHPRG